MAEEKIEALRKQKQAIIEYLTAKIVAGDWHAVQDAASDIREIDAVLKVLLFETETGWPRK